MFTGIVYITSKESFKKTMEKTTFCCFVFVFSKRKTKCQVLGSLFWFENEIVEVILNDCFRKQNETTIKKSKRAQQELQQKRPHTL